MKLVFPGKRGNIEARNARHRRHSSLEVSYRGKRAMIDCGDDWHGALPDLRPRAVVVTHAHPDHAFGLKGGAPCPVYATRSVWIEMADYPLERRHTVSVAAAGDRGHYLRGVWSRALDAGAGGELSGQRRPCADILRARSWELCRLTRFSIPLACGRRTLSPSLPPRPKPRRSPRGEASGLSW